MQMVIKGWMSKHMGFTVLLSLFTVVLNWYQESGNFTGIGMITKFLVS